MVSKYYIFILLFSEFTILEIIDIFNIFLERIKIKSVEIINKLQIFQKKFS